MSDTPAKPVTPARPVSFFTIVFLFAVFAAFLLVIRYFYRPATVAAFNAAPDNISEDLAWRANSANRRQTLQELRASEAEEITKYRWIDQQAGLVQLPIERAMELTARDLASKQPAGSARERPTSRGKL